jgi:Phosphorylase superfamily
MSVSRRPQGRGDFEIAVICALPIECDAVEALFDEFWEDDQTYGKAPGDPNAYSTGRIGNRNVVLATMPGMGKGTSAGVSASFRSSFPGIKQGLLVGICGGLPTGTGEEEIVLGDVIISTGLVQFDFGRQYSDKVVRKDTLQDNLGRPNHEVRAFLAKISGLRARKQLTNHTSIILKKYMQTKVLRDHGIPAQAKTSCTYQLTATNITTRPFALFRPSVRVKMKRSARLRLSYLVLTELWR